MSITRVGVKQAGSDDGISLEHHVLRTVTTEADPIAVSQKQQT
jgi:hypothetical protein